MEEDLADRLKAAREKKGLTQDQLAKRIGKKQSLIGNIESRSRDGSTYIPEIAHVLGIDAYWLKTGKGHKNPARRALTEDEELILAALPLISPDMRESWIDAAKKKLESIRADTNIAA